MLTLACYIKCDKCGVEDKSTLRAGNVSGLMNDFMNIGSWKIDSKNNGWGFIWKMVYKNYSWDQFLYCPQCYELEKALLPKKKGILEKVFG